MNILGDFNTVVALITEILLHPFTLLWMGLITHFIKAMGEIKKNVGVLLTPWQYYMQNPYHSILSLIGALVGYAIFIGEHPDFNDMADMVQNAIRMNAFAVGYMADSVIDMIGQRSTVGKPKPEETKP
jgi:membrane protein implicated in regulation of membrane protease activity